MSSKWTQKEREQAAKSLWPGSNTAAGSPQLEYEWIEQALTAAPRTHFYRMVTLQCEVTALRKELQELVSQSWIDIGSICDGAKEVLEKSK